MLAAGQGTAVVARACALRMARGVFAGTVGDLFATPEVRRAYLGDG